MCGWPPRDRQGNCRKGFFIELPLGKGRTFQKDTEALVAEVRRVLPEMFQSEDYAAKRDATIKQIDEERKSLLS